MKRIVLFITAVLLFAGCAKEQLVEERSYTGPVTVVSATFESLSNGATKADVNDAGTFTWQNGDKAAFTAASGSSYYTGTNSSTSATANFTIYGAPTFTSSSFAFYPSDLTTGKSTSSLAVKVPTTREWVNGQTNVAMYGVKVENEASFNFSHMGGLVRVRVNNVPTNARKFVFKTPDYKISGDFTVEEESGYKVIKTKKHETENPVPEIEQTYTLTWTTAPDAENTMDFYIPLPLGTYANGFAFKFLDGTDAEILSKTSSLSETIARKDLVLMPAITLMGGEIETAEKAAVVANIPAGYSGDFLLPQSEKVLLKINAPTGTADHDITLKYDGANNIPTNLEVKVVDGDNAGDYNAKLLGNLPSTHVDFTNGTIANVEMTTSSSTLEVIYPATISTKLTVKGGNVKIKGATVQAIEVDSDAVADSETGLPVQIAVEKYTPEGGTAQTPDITEGITANASIVVAPDAEVTVNVQTEGDVQVAKAGEGSVTGVTTTDAKAKIGENNYFTLADAVKAAPKNATEATTITLLDNVTDGAGIFLAAADKKNIIIDLNDKTYTASTPVGSAGTVNQAFHLEKGNTIKIQNGTLNVDVNKKTDFRFIIQNYADLTLEGVTVDGSNLGFADKTRYTVSNNCGTVEFKGATNINAAATNGIAFDVCKSGNYDAPKVTWSSSGSVDGEIELTGGEFILGHNLEVNQPVRVKAAATLNLGTYTLSGSSDFSKKGRGVVIVNRVGDLTINGTTGVIDGATNQVSAAVVLTEPETWDQTTKLNELAKLTVNGGTLQGRYYGISGNGGRHNTEITVMGGTIKGTETDNCAGIYHPQNGTLTIGGGTIEGAVGIYVKAGTVTTAVEGGTIKGIGAQSGYRPLTDGFHPTGDAIVFDNCDYPGGAPNATINGGTFTSKNGLAVASYAKEGVEGGPIKPVIKGGTFSDLSGVKYVAEGTYKLANDVTLATPLEITSGKTFTIDLNSKTLTGRTNIAGANVTFTNGKIAGGNNQAINIYGSETSAENYSVVNISNNVEVSADVYAVCVFGKYNGVGVGAGTTGYGAVANIAGTIKTTGDEKNGAVFVSGNLGANSDTEWAVSNKNAVNIKPTAKITSEKDAALALNGSATVTVEAGAQLTGATAIAAKRGKLIVNGGKITGNGTCVGNPNPYKNGIENTGSAVSAMPTYQNDGPLSVELKGGEYTSNAYTILNNHDGCTFQISGGKYETTKAGDGIVVYARLGSVNITGGTFENESNSEATLHVGCPAAVTAQLQPKLTISGNDTVVKNNASGDYTYGGKPLVVNMANQLTYKAVEISGGKFYYRDPSKDDNVSGDNGNFLKSGYSATCDDTNVWTVAASQQN